MINDRVFEIENTVLVSYCGENEEHITLPEGLTEVGEYAFADHREIKSVTMPEGIVRIGQHAFLGCEQLREVKLPDSLKEIRRFAFWECGGIERLIIPDGVTFIGNSAFRGCDMLTELILPDSIENIGESAFSDCYSLAKVNIPKGLSIIRKRAFSDCRSLKELTLPDNITELDDYAFECCARLESISLPHTLKKIGRHCFDGCAVLRSVEIPAGVESIGSSAFYRTSLIDDFAGGCLVLGKGILIQYKGDDEKVQVPKGVEKIGERAFAYSEQLKSVDIPEGVTEIGECAFEYCRSLEKVSLPKSLEKLGDRAFVDCAALTDAVLPDEVMHIGSDVFYGTRLLAEHEEKLLVMNGRYLIRYSGSEDEMAVPRGVRVIADSAFSGSAGVKRAVLPESIRVIGDGAFRWCGDLSEVKIPSSVEYIGKEAFISSEGLCAVIPQSGAAVGEAAFPRGATLCFEGKSGSFKVTLENDLTAPGSHSENALYEFSQKPDDNSFKAIGEPCYMIPAAMCYADSISSCRDYIRDNITEVMCYHIDREDNEGISRILAFGYLNEEYTQRCISYAIDQKRLEQQVTLMRFKQQTFGSRDTDRLADDKFAL